MKLNQFAVYRVDQQTAGKALWHAASWKDISGKSIGDDETESKRNSCNLTWF